MLLAHCEVLRTEMFSRETKAGKDIPVTDIYPDTFKNLLRYVYGFDNSGNLSFNEADDLLYVAEKYNVESLKARLSTRLMKLLNSNNICNLMNNPACYRVLELNAAITKILQYETDKVLASPDFLDLTVNNLDKVMEQTKMNVSEIEVWRAAVRWAKRRRDTDDGKVLRKEMKRPAKHIRICTIDKVTLCDEVFTSDILTKEEIKLVCLAKSEGVKQEALVCFSNEIECRERTSLACHLSFKYHNITTSSTGCELFILTKSHAIELLPLNYTGMKSSLNMAPKGLTYTFRSTITIIRITNYNDGSSTEALETIQSTQQVQYEEKFSVPFIVRDKNVVLQPNRKYRLKLQFSGTVTMYKCNESKTYDNEHISVQAVHYSADQYRYSSSYNNYLLPSNMIHYRHLPG